MNLELRDDLPLLIWAGLLAVSIPAASCEDVPTVEQRDLREFRNVYRTGLRAPDPYVRAETLRLVEEFERPDLPGRPREMLGDPDPMVRVAALRALLATEHPRAPNSARTRFAEAGAPEKRAVLEAVLELGAGSLQRSLVWRALHESQATDVRRFAADEALDSWIRTAREDGHLDTLRRQLASNARKYIRELDAEVGGPVLEAHLELGEREAARPAVAALRDADDEYSTDERLRAAKILLEARAESATEVFRSLLDRARNQGEQGGLEVPETGLDERLVRRAVLGVVARGDRDLVPRAKSYLQGASTDVYIEVLEALRLNGAEGARLALRNAMKDARPRVRRRAIELYGAREDARVSALLDVALGGSSSPDPERDRRTRRTVGRVLGRHFSTDWTDRLKPALQNSSRIRPALGLLGDVYRATDGTEHLDRLRTTLGAIAKSDERRVAAPAAYLLAVLPEGLADDGLRRRVESLRDPLPRYAVLHRIAASNPSDRIGYLLENFYPDHRDLESFQVRLVSGVGLWLARHPSPKSEATGSGDSNST